MNGLEPLELINRKPLKMSDILQEINSIRDKIDLKCTRINELDIDTKIEKILARLSSNTRIVTRHQLQVILIDGRLEIHYCHSLVYSSKYGRCTKYNWIHEWYVELEELYQEALNITPAQVKLMNQKHTLAKLKRNALKIGVNL